MEFLDLVDRDDNVVGKASYKEIYDRLLRHRIVHVFIFNNKGEMALQMRSRHKGFCPLHWCTPASGHVQAGESYEQAALREMDEEIGIQTDLSFMSKDIYVDKNYRGRGPLEKILGTFKALNSGPFQINPKEVERIEFFKIDQIKQMIKREEKFHPELLFLLKKHFKIKT